MKNSSSQNSLNSQQPVDSIQLPIFKKLFRDLGVPSEYQNGLSRELSSYLSSSINDETRIEQLSRAYILEFLKGIGLDNQKGQSKTSIAQTGEGSSLFSKNIKGDDDKKAQVNLIYQISKAEIFKSLHLLRYVKNNLSNAVQSLANIITNDEELLSIYKKNIASFDNENPLYQDSHIDDISSISAMIAKDLSDDFKKDPRSFSHLGINKEQLDDIAKLSPQEINKKIQKGIEDKKQSRLNNIKKSIEEGLISLLHVDKQTNDKNALEEILKTGKIKFEEEEGNIKVTKINDIDAQNKKEIIKNNDQLINNIKDLNRQDGQMIDQEAFDFTPNSSFAALGLVLTCASKWTKRIRAKLHTDPVFNSVGGPNSTSQSLTASQLKPNTRFEIVE